LTYFSFKTPELCWPEGLDMVELEAIRGFTLKNPAVATLAVTASLTSALVGCLGLIGMLILGIWIKRNFAMLTHVSNIDN
jgi:hypothetical protein